MIVLAAVVILIVTLYLYGTRTFKYWEKRGVKYVKPLPFIGTNAVVLLLKKSITEQLSEFYDKYKGEKIVGFFRATRPNLLIRDPEIIKRILTTDFVCFYSRGFNKHKNVIEPMMRNLFFADGDVWKLLRQRMTPAFSSGKLKAMFPLIVERAEKLQQVLADDSSEHCKTLNARDVMARYTTDFIGAVGFGLESNSLTDEKSAFRDIGIKIFAPTLLTFFKAIIKDTFPNTFKHIKVMGEVEKDLYELVTAIMKQRNYEPSGRHDFIDLMLECKKKGIITGESIEKIKSDGTSEEAQLELDDWMITAQAFVFFAAGFETSSSATSFTLLQLAYHPDIQKKVQAEIDKVLKEHGNKMSYDAIKEMTYLEWTFNESMRMFPSLGFLKRQCARQYTFKELDVTIDPGVSVFIPVQSLQNDPEYFDNPTEFRPERFGPGGMSDIAKTIYLPFGVGPRACIGERLGLMQSITGLAAVLSKYSVEPAPETVRKPIVDPKSGVVQVVKGGIPLVFRTRTDALP